MIERKKKTSLCERFIFEKKKKDREIERKNKSKFLSARFSSDAENENPRLANIKIYSCQKKATTTTKFRIYSQTRLVNVPSLCEMLPGLFHHELSEFLFISLCVVFSF